jgi:hypothetical protein
MCGVDLAIHAKGVENFLGLVDQSAGIGGGEKLGEVGLAEFVNKVEFPIGKQAGAADSAEDIAWSALDAPPVADRTYPLERRFAFFDDQYPQAGMFAEVIGGKRPAGPQPTMMTSYSFFWDVLPMDAPGPGWFTQPAEREEVQVFFSSQCSSCIICNQLLTILQ